MHYVLHVYAIYVFQCDFKIHTISYCFTYAFFKPFYFNVPWQIRPHLNLRSLIFGLTSFDWLLSVMLNYYFCRKYNFWFTPFYLHPLFPGTHPGPKARAGYTGVLLEHLHKRGHSEDLGVDGKILYDLSLIVSPFTAHLPHTTLHPPDIQWQLLWSGQRQQKIKL